MAAYCVTKQRENGRGVDEQWGTPSDGISSGFPRQLAVHRPFVAFAAPSDSTERSLSVRDGVRNDWSCINSAGCAWLALGDSEAEGTVR